MDLLENLKKIEEEAELALAEADSLEKLEELRIVFLVKRQDYRCAKANGENFSRGKACNRAGCQ